MKTRSDFVSNSSSCSFFVAIKTPEDAQEFNKLVDRLLQMNASIQLFCSLSEANDRWYGVSFDGSEQMKNAVVPGCYMLCDACDDHYTGFEEKFYAMEGLFTNGEHKFKLYSDPEAHMSSGEKLPKCEGPDGLTLETWGMT